MMSPVLYLALVIGLVCLGEARSIRSANQEARHRRPALGQHHRAIEARNLPISSVEWSALGCFTDDSIRTLDGAWTDAPNMTPAICTSWCARQGYSYSGMAMGTQV